MALPGEIGWIGANCPDCNLPLTTVVSQSGAGWFVGTECPRCYPGEVWSRESAYYPSRGTVEAALANYCVTWRDTDHHPTGGPS
jgi:hypothetical protein